MEPSASSPTLTPLSPRLPRAGRRRATVALVATLSAGLGACAASQGWMPALVLGGSVSRSRAAQDEVTDGSAPRELASWTVRGDLSLAWLPSASESRHAPRRTRPQPELRSAPCASDSICAWEREARARASSGVVAEESTP